MATAVVGSVATEYKVADISLADFGRKEIEIAELKNALAMAKQKKTLRDEFAMAALTGYVSNHDEFFIDDVVKSCYIIADAMLKERMK